MAYEPMKALLEINQYNEKHRNEVEPWPEVEDDLGEDGDESVLVALGQ